MLKVGVRDQNLNIEKKIVSPLNWIMFKLTSKSFEKTKEKSISFIVLNYSF